MKRQRGLEDRAVNAPEWADWERRLGVTFPLAARKFLVTQMLNGIRDEDDLESLRSSIPDYVRLAKSTGEGSAKSRAVGPPPKTTGPKRKRIYPKALQRRLRVLRFVTEHLFFTNEQDDYQSVTDRDLRIRWGRLSKKWNQEFPHDPMTAETLRVAYRDARSDPRPRDAYFEEKLREAVGALSEPSFILPSWFPLAMLLFTHFTHSSPGGIRGAIRPELPNRDGDGDLDGDFMFRLILDERFISACAAALRDDALRDGFKRGVAMIGNDVAEGRGPRPRS